MPIASGRRPGGLCDPAHDVKAIIDGYTAFSFASRKTGALPPVVKALPYVAVDISTTHLIEPGVRIQTRNPLRYRATLAQVPQVMQRVRCVDMQRSLPDVRHLQSATPASV
ncbi:carboxymuconolactone decarboxylase [Burkholderia lata]|nr:carboxymuconolactone decarboxylase [Burkholderia lata]